MGDQQLHKVNEIMALLGITDQTVRVYCNRYGRFLSEHAAPKPGQTRRFTDADVRILMLIRDASASRTVDVAGAVDAALRDGRLPELPAMSAERAVSAQTVQAARESWLVERSALQRDIEGLQGQVDRLQAQVDVERAARLDDLRALADVREKLGRAEAVLELYESGRLQGKA